MEIILLIHHISTQDYLYLLKVPDKKAVSARIRAVDELIHKFI